MNVADARVIGTRNAIRKSFLELLRNKTVNRITVREICEMSRINRSTFYKHYRDIPDVLEKMEEEILSGLTENLKPTLPRMESYLDMVMTEMKARGDIYLILASENADPDFPAKIFWCCYRAVYPQFERKFPYLTDAQRDMVYRFLAQGSGGILSGWIRDGMQEPKEKVIDLLLRLNGGAVSLLQ
ncbi:MAG TPA: TetR/AcrR family transcriptional regulator [Candidatus Eisenbergiella merdavium]|uniref:TetR/AcrR family transcriptional regulator n=1 Tax=Candidatus Eisenbergiella merdavium TaxID=2838551 RepID=A0A9D2NG45_9FIRM|nr:TetR/AcrR family transcriptional regulator [Candidatus Eisenbergiella merdavium]